MKMKKVLSLGFQASDAAARRFHRQVRGMSVTAAADDGERKLFRTEVRRGAGDRTGGARRRDGNDRSGGAVMRSLGSLSSLPEMCYTYLAYHHY